ncbi:PH domain-containing protein [Fulvivirga sedimenti]|uniref:PH domain-containing protein n=1 Tax=Fulvivirga sedimenti TaxID=2879465 RepID=A0A9X1KWK7_9BACT|nr:PH domain-containing protein [Fulvivirga sedimenti]MCA6074059.1 PH domain-containing protein [Fulvivirga sedimenti]
MNKQIDFTKPQRQSLLGVVVYFLKNGRAMVSILIALFVVSGKFEYGSLYLLLALIVLTLLVLTISYLQYKNFTFQIRDDELIIHMGVIFKEKRIIPFDRIQSVHIHQNFIQQILQVVGLKIDSAGSQKKELEISALDSATARAFQKVLEAEKAGEESQVTEETILDETRIELMRLSISDLFKVGFTENHLKSGLLAIAVVVGYFNQYSQYFEDYLEEYVSTDIKDYLPEIIRMGTIMVLGGVLVFIVVSIIISLVRTVLRFFEFRAWLDKNIIGISSGLLKKNEFRIPVKKVQYLVWHSNPLRKLLGFESVQIKQAQSAKEVKKQIIEIPACYRNHSDALENLVFGSTIQEGKTIIRPNIVPYVLISTYVSILLVGGLIGWMYLLRGTLEYSFMLAAPAIIFLTFMYARSISVDIQEELLIIRKGWIFPSRFILPYHKAQSMAIHQSIFLKRRKLSNCRFYTASGTVGIRYLPEPITSFIHDYTLYKTETYQGSWM